MAATWLSRVCKRPRTVGSRAVRTARFPLRQCLVELLLDGLPLILQIETFRNSRTGFRQVVEFGPEGFEASVEPLRFVAADLLCHFQIGLQLHCGRTLLRQQGLPKRWIFASSSYGRSARSTPAKTACKTVIV